MPALAAGIHVFLVLLQDVDGRDKPGHDEFGRWYLTIALHFPSIGTRILPLSMRLTPST